MCFTNFKTKNNKIDVEATTKLAKIKLCGDEFKVQKANEVAKKCADVTDPDRCEAASKIFHCSHDAVKSLGITFDNIWTM